MTFCQKVGFMAATQIPDKTITQQVEKRLSGRGISSPCRVTVATRNGEVTLSGTVRQPQQKTTAVQAASMISGVRRVIDQLTVKAAAKF